MRYWQRLQAEARERNRRGSALLRDGSPPMQHPNVGPFNHYVVQSFYVCSQFSTLDIARRHAELNAPARIWHGSDVTEIWPRGRLAHKAGALALEIYGCRAALQAELELNGSGLLRWYLNENGPCSPYIKVGVRQLLDGGSWRLSYNGMILGDGVEHPTRHQAEVRARALVHESDGAFELEENQ